MLILVDGIDGSGKSTVLAAWKKFLLAQGNPVFDLNEYWQEHGRHPELAELKSYDFIVSAEPTRVGVGLSIRRDLINTHYSYPPRSVAQAYALDRLVLYTRLMIPLLASGKCVLQDRGISTTLCYQPLMHASLTAESLLELDGNRLAMQQAPDHLVLVRTDPRVAMERLESRLEKQDNVIFERLDFAKKAAAVFESRAFQGVFAGRGTRWHYLPGDEKIDILQTQATTLLASLLNS